MAKEKKTHVCPLERAGSLDNRLRKLLQNPQKILGSFVKEGITAMDIGCGPGFFSVPMALLVGDSGRVVAVDLQEGMLNKIRQKIKGSELESRFIFHKCQADSIGFPEQVDFALAFYMAHEVPDQLSFFQDLKTIVKPGGRFFLVEPKIFHVSKKDFAETIAKVEGAGFVATERPKIPLSQAMLFKA